jgi:hypothetical protein
VTRRGLASDPRKRKVVVENIDVTYEGGRTLLENVSFIDCRFHMVHSQGAIRLSRQFLDSASRNVTANVAE